MRKITTSIIAVAAVGTFAWAGGNIAPVEETTPIVSNSMPFYIGLGYSRINADGKGQTGGLNAVAYEAESRINANNYLLLAGIQVNQYLAIEGRYSNSFQDLKLKNKTTGTKFTLPDSELESYGIYLKPMYPVTDKINIYGLLGYANIKISDIGGDFIDDGGFSYGVGASYGITDRWAVFVDVVSLYNDTYINNADFWGQNGGYKVKAESINLGATYTF